MKVMRSPHGWGLFTINRSNKTLSSKIHNTAIVNAITHSTLSWYNSLHYKHKHKPEKAAAAHKLIFRQPTKNPYFLASVQQIVLARRTSADKARQDILKSSTARYCRQDPILS